MRIPTRAPLLALFLAAAGCRQTPPPTDAQSPEMQAIAQEPAPGDPARAELPGAGPGSSSGQTGGAGSQVEPLGTPTPPAGAGEWVGLDQEIESLARSLGAEDAGVDVSGFTKARFSYSDQPRVEPVPERPAAPVDVTDLRRRASVNVSQPVLHEGAPTPGGLWWTIQEELVFRQMLRDVYED
jgi:hypothetical protein